MASISLYKDLDSSSWKKKRMEKTLWRKICIKSDNSRDWRTKEKHLQTCHIDAHEMRIMVATVAK